MPKDGSAPMNITLTMKDSNVWSLLPEAVESIHSSFGSKAVARAKLRAEILAESDSYAWVVGGVLAKDSSGEAFAIPGWEEINLSVDRIHTAQAMQIASDLCKKMSDMIYFIGQAETKYKTAVDLHKGPRGKTNNAKENCAMYVNHNLNQLIELGIDQAELFVQDIFVKILREACLPGTAKTIIAFARVEASLKKNWSKKK